MKTECKLDTNPLCRLLLMVLALGLANVGCKETDEPEDAEEAECPTDCRRYVDIDATGTPDGRSWETAFRDVYTGVASAETFLEDQPESCRCEVWVAAGEDPVFESGGKSTVALTHGIDLIGGFEGDETDLAERDWISFETVLDGRGRDGARVLSADDGVTIDGLTVTRSDESLGGGLVIEKDAAVTVRNCRFYNGSDGRGGGIYAKHSGSLEAGPVDIVNCVFENNHGGALEFGSIGRILGCVFRSNTDPASAVLRLDGRSVVENCLIAQNESLNSIIDSTLSDTILIGNTIVNNTTNNKDGHGGSVALGPASDTTLVNNIIWGNEPNDIVIDAIASPFPSVDARYNNWETVLVQDPKPDIEQGLNGPGNISADPLFVDVDAGDFRLSAGSPCIDTGDPDAGVNDDITGRPRDARPDMGAYEYR